RHHTWWLTIAAVIVLHQSIRRLRRLTIIDLEPAAEPMVSAVGSSRSRDKALLDVRRLDSGYGALHVLFSVDLAVAPGEVVALLGPNGAGKTTLLRSIAGLHPTWSGRVQYSGVDLAGLDAAGRAGAGLMLISPEAAIARPLTVDDNLRLFANTLSVAEMRAARERAFETFPKLKERLRQSAGTLSGGERQMLALARAVMLRPRLLLIDELTLGLSPAAIADLGPALRRLNDEGVAMVIVEQSTSVALSLAQRAVCIERGAIVADFPADELRAQPDLIRAIHLDGMSSVLANRAAS
ncbi:MAG: ABC transporter ATP-binding protein, partial [Actinomycetota bacterium]